MKKIIIVIAFILFNINIYAQDAMRVDLIKVRNENTGTNINIYTHKSNLNFNGYMTHTSFYRITDLPDNDLSGGYDHEIIGINDCISYLTDFSGNLIAFYIPSSQDNSNLNSVEIKKIFVEFMGLSLSIGKDYDEIINYLDNHGIRYRKATVQGSEYIYIYLKNVVNNKNVLLDTTFEIKFDSNKLTGIRFFDPE